MQRNLLLTLSFDGTAYHGWQVQSNAVTVQSVVQDAIESVTQARSSVTGCSRTDAGVHASMYCCNFRTNSGIACEKLPAALNYYLPADIAVREVREVPEGFHARYDCLGKTYRYRIWNAKTRSPFWSGRACPYPYPLEEVLLHRQAQAYLGTQDFSAFCAAGSSVQSNVRTVRCASVEREGDLVIFTVEADGFLYHMVRIMAGTLLDIAQGRLLPDSIPEIIASKQRVRAGVTAPACGLYLDQVRYGG